MLNDWTKFFTRNAAPENDNTSGATKRPQPIRQTTERMKRACEENRKSIERKREKNIFCKSNHIFNAVG